MMTRIASLLSHLLLVTSAMAVAAVDDYSNNRSLQITSNAAITEDQYQTCLKDVLTADQNGDYELSASEFIRFVTFNSAVYGYTWGYAAGQTSFDQMPLNFPMLFYTQACLCAQEAESSGCCSAERAHVNIFTGPKYGSGGVTEKQDIYMREFCTEAFHSYAVTFTPTPMPTPLPMTPAPTPSQPTTGEVSKTIVCGRGDVPTNPCSEGLKGTALVDEIHEVRCCLDCSVVGCSLPWKRKCPSFEPNISARSKFAGVCKRGTFAEALDFCGTFNTGAFGSRLCTPLEIENSCAKGTGCNFDKEQVWACAYHGHVCEVDAECCGSCVNGQCEWQ